MTFRLLTTGSRHHEDRGLIWGVLDQYRLLCGSSNLVVVEGGADGADTLVREWAEFHGVTFETYPADWDQHGKDAGPIRNSYMVSLGANECVGFPLVGSKGTYDCMRKARKVGIKTTPHRRITPPPEGSGWEQLTF